MSLVGTRPMPRTKILDKPTRCLVIIDNPNNFIEDVKASIGREIKSELVHYFHIDEGFPAENGQMQRKFIRPDQSNWMKYLICL